MTTRHGAIAVPAVLWLAAAFLVRHWVILLVVFASARRSPEASRLLGQDFSWVMLAVEVPVLLVALAGGHRKPDAGPFWRLLWRNGRPLLMLVAALDLLIGGYALWSADVWRRWPDLFIASCMLIDVAILYALSTDRFFRQLFADFPEAPGAKAA